MSLREALIHLARLHEPEPTPYQVLTEQPNLRHEAIRRLKAKGHKQPKVDQIMSELKRMGAA